MAEDFTTAAVKRVEAQFEKSGVSENCAAFEKVAGSFNIEYSKIGQVTGDKISINDIYKDLDKVSYIYFNKFKEVIEQDL